MDRDKQGPAFYQLWLQEELAHERRIKILLTLLCFCPGLGVELSGARSQQIERDDAMVDAGQECIKSERFGL